MDSSSKGNNEFKEYLERLEQFRALLKTVEIDDAALERVAATITPEQLLTPRWDSLAIPRLSPPAMIDFFFVMNSLNFSFWPLPGRPRWRVNWRGEIQRGAFALFAALSRALEESMPILEPTFLKELSQDQVGKILRGEDGIEIPMLKERTRALNELGDVLCASGKSGISKLLLDLPEDAGDVVYELMCRFPSFNDRIRYQGAPLLFAKRVQLAVAMCYGRLADQGSIRLTNVAQLTLFPDYRLPQALRTLGIIRYPESLARLVDTEQLIPAGNDVETEIRLATVICGKLMVNKLQQRIPAASALNLDYYLWQQARTAPKQKPYHLTRTIFY